MTKIIIVGCGYGGVVCAWRLSAAARRREVSVQVIARGQEFSFPPLFPDTIGRGLAPSSLSYPISRLSRAYAFESIHDEVRAVDIEKRQVVASGGTYEYDYLVLASGTQTNFYGNDVVRHYAYTLDNPGDARRILAGLAEKTFSSLVIAGGGYTGVEVATNLWRYLQRNRRQARIIIVERAASILGPLPQWMKRYVEKNLQSLGIEVMPNTLIEKIEPDCLVLSGGQRLQNSMLIWAAGVRTADYIQGIAKDKNPQGRLMVDPYLRVDAHCFAVGDAAAVPVDGGLLRMAVQFAIAQGRCAAENILRSIRHRPLCAYRPFDIGYLIPMAHNRSCGILLGNTLRGRLPVVLHYLMCVYRVYGLKNKMAIIRALCTGGGR